MIRGSLKVTSRGFSTSVLRAAAEQAAAATTSSAAASPSPVPKTGKAEFPVEAISSSLFLSRIPIITPNLSEFEKLYYHYQDELSRRLMWTFPYFYYFKKSSLAEKKFLDMQKWPVSKQPNVFYPKGVPDIKHNRERRQKQVINLKEETSDLEKKLGLATKKDGEDDISRPIEPNSRVTEADKVNDLKSLERKLDQTLYLVVQDKKTSQWKLPSFAYGKADPIVPLHLHAEENIQKLSIQDINLYNVTNKPIHVVKYGTEDKKNIVTGEDVKAKEYVIKSHILAGNFKLKNDDQQYKDYLWLNNEELKEYLSADYFKQIEFLLADY